MKRILVFCLCLTVLVGCGDINKISEEDAHYMVMEEHETGLGTVEIKSITKNGSEYIVEWENTDDCSSGTEYVNHRGIKKDKSVYQIC